MMEFYGLPVIPVACGIIFVIVGAIQLLNLRKTDAPEAVPIFWVWLLGLIAVAGGILGHVFKTIEAFNTIAMAGDISPTLVANGMSGAYNHTFLGLIILINSLIVWGVLKTVKNKRMVVLNQ